RNRLEFANGSLISHLISILGSNMNGRASSSPLSIREKHTFSGMDSRYKLEPGQRASHTSTQSTGNAIFAREPLRKKYREWYFLVYLKLTYNTNNDDKDIILKEIKKYIPVTIELWIIISLVEFIIGDKYKYFFEYNTQMLEYNISSYQYKMVKWLANVLVNHKDDYM
ncbi:13931_t:CDS:2, partial [Racocetra persica]